MPEIVFDGKKITVPAGTNLIEAGLVAGVPVPVFCYHKDLGAVGSCRVCAVTVTLQGKSRLVMGCMTDAAEGMDVTTLDNASIELRKYVLEWLMVNHPHDCPICDEGGECQLQDLTIAAGHSIRRLNVRKRTFENQYLGEFIQHEMNRCITCYRCSRFYQEYAGGRDFGATGSRDRVYFGRFEEGPLESPFSGNLVEMCPTGVFTDKLFRYKSRVWDLEMARSVCPHCSVGCNVIPGSRHRELQRVRVGVNPAVNGVFLCDRGQFGHGYVMDPARPKRVRVRAETTGTLEAIGVAGADLLAIARQHGAASIALIASPRASLETHVALESLRTGPLEGARISHFDDPGREPRAIAALAALKQAGTAPLEQSDLGDCDVLIVAGTSLVDEAPLAALGARQAARKGGKVFVLHSGERYLGDVAQVFPVHPARLAQTLGEVTAEVGGRGPKSGAAAEIAAALKPGQRVGVLLGSDLLDGPAFRAGAELANALRAGGADVRLGYLFPGPNGFGAAALSSGANLAGILADLVKGAFRAAVVVESDVAAWGPRAIEALGKLELLVGLDDLPGPLVEMAHVLLPTTVTYESSGTYVNRAGRAQAFAPAHVPGLSVIEMIDGESFPRQPRHAPPESDARMAWWLLEAMREAAIGKPAARTLTQIRAQLRSSHARWKALVDLAPGGAGAVLDPALFEVTHPELPAFGAAEQGAMVFRTDRTLGSEPLSSRSAAIRKMAGPPVAVISAADAQRFGVNGSIALTIGGGTVSLPVETRDDVAPGIVFVPRDARWPEPVAQGTIVGVKATAGAPA